MQGLECGNYAILVVEAWEKTGSIRQLMYTNTTVF